MLPSPLEVRAQPIHRLIDEDKTGFYLKKCSSNSGRGHRTCRVQCPTPYRQNEANLNVILVFESVNANIPVHMDGSIEKPRKWFRLTVDNVDQFIFGGLVNEILNKIEKHPLPGNYDLHKIIIWNNLRAHKTPFVTNIIEDRESENRFEPVDRPPYIPKLAPIEYVFCELAAELSRQCNRNWKMEDLSWKCIDII